MGLQNAFKMDINEFAASEKVISNDIVHNLIGHHALQAQPGTVRREHAIIDKVNKF